MYVRVYVILFSFVTARRENFLSNYIYVPKCMHSKGIPGIRPQAWNASVTLLDYKTADRNFHFKVRATFLGNAHGYRECAPHLYVFGLGDAPP